MPIEFHKFILPLYLLLAISSFAQDDTLQILNDNLYRYFDYASENLEDSDFQAVIEELIEKPIDLNSASKSDLLNIPFISPKIANHILKYRKDKGCFNSLFDLLNIKSVDMDLFLLVKPFVEIGSYEHKKSMSQSSFSFRSRMISDLQTKEGYKNGKYKGTKYKIYNRLRANIGNISFGILSEKDPGEISILDHYAGYIHFKSIPLLENLLIGDYNMEFGQGLVLWRPYSFSKGSEAVTTPIKQSRIYKPFLSTEENLFFRGIITSVKFDRVIITGLFSAKKMDANIEENQIINLNLSGYHRTEAELNKTDKVERKSIGLKLVYQPSAEVKLGILNLFDKFSHSFLYKSKNDLYGQRFQFTSISYDINYNELNFSGELGCNGSSFAFIGNIFIGVNERTDVLISYRNYSPSFYNINSNGFGEFGNTKNEIGYYLGIKSITEFGKFNIYFDLFKCPSPKYGVNFPSVGYDFLMNYSKKIKSGSNISFKYKREKKEANLNTNILRRIQDITKKSYRIELDYKISKYIRSKSRIEYVEYKSKNEDESGFSTYQQLKLILNKNFYILSRITMFDTDSYNSRIYHFENDLQGLMTNKVLYEEGFRWFVLLNFSPLRFLKFSIKYSDTFQPNKTEIGTGNSKIKGNVANHICAQLDISF